jgi:hypothetical protein
LVFSTLSGMSREDARLGGARGKMMQAMASP